MTRTRVAFWLFAVTSILSFLAALLPVLKGEDINVASLGGGVIFLAIALATAKRARTASTTPPPLNVAVKLTPQPSDAWLASPGAFIVKPRTAAWGLLVVGILVLAAAVFPLTRGGSVNVALLLLAGALIVLAPIVAKKAGSAGSGPPTA